MDQIIKGRDGLIRRATIKYFNAEENDPASGNYRARLTDRAVRSLVKLWSLEECSLFDDLAQLSDVSHSNHDSIMESAYSSLVGDGGSSSLTHYVEKSSSKNVLQLCVSLVDGTCLDARKYFFACDLRPLCGHHERNDDVEFIQDCGDTSNLTALLLATGFDMNVRFSI